jgi:hypothetical protein
VAQLIENLPFLETVKKMLLENTSASDVATFIQDDQEALLDIKHKTLVNALAEKRRALIEEMNSMARTEAGVRGEIQAENVPEWYDTGRDDEVDKVALPSAMARAAYKRVKEGVEELHELEGLYLSARERLDRLIEREHQVNVFSDMTAKEFSTAADLLMKRVTVKEKLGILRGDTAGRGDVRDFDGYSRETAEVLNDPRSRRRVISIVERLKANQKAMLAKEEDEDEDGGGEQAAG